MRKYNGQYPEINGNNLEVFQAPPTSENTPTGDDHGPVEDFERGAETTGMVRLGS